MSWLWLFAQKAPLLDIIAFYIDIGQWCVAEVRMFERNTILGISSKNDFDSLWHTWVLHWDQGIFCNKQIAPKVSTHLIFHRWAHQSNFPVKLVHILRVIIANQLFCLSFRYDWLVEIVGEAQFSLFPAWVDAWLSWLVIRICVLLGHDQRCDCRRVEHLWKCFTNLIL